MRFKWLFAIILLLSLSFCVTQKNFNRVLAPQEVKNILQTLQQEIKKKNLNFTVGDNPALNYSINQLCRMEEPKDWESVAKKRNIKALNPAMLKSAEGRVGLPTKWDWRDSDDVTIVKDQEDCGSCWAFGTIASLESLLLINNDKNTDLSEQHLVSCNSKHWGCDGGWWAHDLLINPGAVLESDFPYTAKEEPCGGSYNYPYQLSGWAYVDGDSKLPSVQKIKQAVYQYGPVCAAVFVGYAFQAYTGGVFDKDEAPKPNGNGCSNTPAEPVQKVNHAIVIIGWDDDKGAWIIKNSWGPNWGENGYMYIKYETSNVGYASVIVY